MRPRPRRHAALRLQGLHPALGRPLQVHVPAQHVRLPGPAARRGAGRRSEAASDDDHSVPRHQQLSRLRGARGCGDLQAARAELCPFHGRDDHRVRELRAPNRRAGRTVCPVRRGRLRRWWPDLLARHLFRHRLSPHAEREVLCRWRDRLRLMPAHQVLPADRDHRDRSAAADRLAAAVLLRGRPCLRSVRRESELRRWGCCDAASEGPVRGQAELPRRPRRVRTFSPHWLWCRGWPAACGEGQRLCAGRGRRRLPRAARGVPPRAWAARMDGPRLDRIEPRGLVPGLGCKPQCHSSLRCPTSRSRCSCSQVDYGEPLGPMRIEGNVARRSWSNYEVSLDCSTFTATFDPK